MNDEIPRPYYMYMVEGFWVTCQLFSLLETDNPAPDFSYWA
jgi:hypothetical protein